MKIKINNMRKQHQRLHCIMQMIEHADTMVSWSAFWPERQFRYIAIRSRLYKAYSHQIAKICSSVICVL